MCTSQDIKPANMLCEWTLQPAATPPAWSNNRYIKHMHAAVVRYSESQTQSQTPTTPEEAAPTSKPDCLAPTRARGAASDVETRGPADCSHTPEASSESHTDEKLSDFSGGLYQESLPPHKRQFRDLHIRTILCDLVRPGMTIDCVEQCWPLELFCPGRGFDC